MRFVVPRNRPGVALDAGGHRQLYIATKRIAGQTLRAWTQARRHSWSEIVDMYAAASRGLIAAHEARLEDRASSAESVSACRARPLVS